MSAALGLWVAFQSMSGVALLFGDSIEHWRHADLTRHGPGDRGAAEVLAVVRQNFPGEEVGVLATPAVSDGVYVVEVGERDVYVDPAGPRINGSRSRDGGLLGLIRRLHRRFLFVSLLGLPGAWVVGAAAIAWLVLSIGDVVTAARERFGAHWRRDPPAWQGLFGVLLVAPIVLVVVTGIRLALPAGTDRVWAALTGSGLARPDVPPGDVGIITSDDRGATPRNATELLGELSRRYPAGRVARLLMPPPDDRTAPVIAGLSVGFDPGRNEHDHGGNTVVFLDQYTAEPLWEGTPDALPAARQAALLWSRPLHTGSVLGEPGRLLWATIAVALLALAALGFTSGRNRPVAARRRQRVMRRRLRRRKALARRRRTHSARAARVARVRRRTRRRLRRRRKVQARTRARMRRTRSGAGTPDFVGPQILGSEPDVEIDLTERIEIDLTDRANVDVRTRDRSRFPPD